MSIKSHAVDLDPANWIWLQGRAIAAGGRNVSEILNEILAQIRTAGTVRTGRSTRATIRLPESDPDLDEAQQEVRELFHRSIERSAHFLNGLGVDD